MSLDLFSLIGASRGDVIDRLRSDDERIRGRAPLTVRLAFLGADGGTGCSTAASGVAGLLKARRSGPILLVNAAGDGPDCLIRAGFTWENLAEKTPLELEDNPTRASEALAGFPVGGPGIYGLDLAGLSGSAPSDWQSWRQVLGPRARFLDVICTDFGRRALAESQEIAQASAGTIVCCRPDRIGLERAAWLAQGLKDRGPTTLCVTDLSNSVNTSAIQELTSGLGVPVITLPYEKGLGNREQVGRTVPGTLNRHYRLAAIGLAAQAMELHRSPDLGGARP